MPPEDSSPNPRPSGRVRSVKIQTLSASVPTAGEVSSQRVPVTLSSSVPVPVPSAEARPSAAVPLPTVITGEVPLPVLVPEVPFHAPPVLTPAKRPPGFLRYWRQVGGGSLILSLIIHAGLLVSAYYVVHTIASEEKPVDFLPGGGSKSGEEASNQLAHAMKQKRRKMVSQDSPTRKITTRDGVSSIQLSDIPMESMELPDSSSMMGRLGSSGFGSLGAGSDFSTGQGMGGTAKGFTPMTFFGRVGGEGLPGAFYDMKQDRSRKPLPYSGQFPDYIAVINRAASKKFSPTALNDYYKAKQEVTFTYLMVPNMDAGEGPKCFSVEKEVEPRGWFVHYSGMVTPPKSGTYRFVGFFDDLLIVYINNKPVLDGSWVPMAGVGEGKYEDEIRQEFKGPPVAGGRTAYFGKWVKMNEPFKLDIVVGETPGGRVGGLLMVQDKSAKYEERKDGTPILPIFTTTQLEAEDLKRLSDDPYAKAVQIAPNPPIFSGKRSIFEKEETSGLGLLPKKE